MKEMYNYLVSCGYTNILMEERRAKHFKCEKDGKTFIFYPDQITAMMNKG